MVYSSVSEMNLCFLPYQAKEPSLSYYSLIAGWKRHGFISFPRTLVQSEMQTPDPGFKLGLSTPFPMMIYIYIYIYTQGDLEYINTL